MPSERVIVHFDENGDLSYLVEGQSVQLFIIDERCPNDRVYAWLPREDGERLDAVLGSDPVGSCQDERHNAIAHAVNAYMDGKPHLSVVPHPTSKEPDNAG